jgi:hypothetical protein
MTPEGDADAARRGARRACGRHGEVAERTPRRGPVDWDAAVREVLRHLEAAGLTEARADALFTIGSLVDGRPGKSPEQSEWALACLRESLRLWTGLGGAGVRRDAADARRRCGRRWSAPCGR